jgi:hypothetical protein
MPQLSTPWWVHLWRWICAYCIAIRMIPSTAWLTKAHYDGAIEDGPP